MMFVLIQCFIYPSVGPSIGTCFIFDIHICIICIICFGINQTWIFLNGNCTIYRLDTPGIFPKQHMQLNMDAQTEFVKEERLSWKPIIFTLHLEILKCKLQTFLVIS